MNLLTGVVAVGSQDVVSGAASPLHAFTTPLLITDPTAAHTITPTHNLFTTAPHLSDHLQVSPIQCTQALLSSSYFIHEHILIAFPITAH